MTKVLVIPDTQVRPGVDLGYLHDIGEYWIDKKPDVVVHLGDHWDFPSLSSYDQGKMAFEGRRYKADVFAGNLGMMQLLKPLNTYNAKQRQNGKKQYWPRQVFLLGNHENRVERAVNDDAKLEGTIGYHDLDLNGWEVHPFLEVVVIEGVAFSHYFTTGVMGRPATTASALLSKKHMSCIQGHQQGRQVASGFRADGNQITAIIAGSAYPHDEAYMGIQGNKHWRGVIMLHNVDNGSFDECFVPLEYLRNKYGAVKGEVLQGSRD